MIVALLHPRRLLVLGIALSLVAPAYAGDVASTPAVTLDHAPRIVAVGTSITDLNSPMESTASIAATRGGDTVVTVATYTTSLLGLQAGDPLYVCNGAGNGATQCEMHHIAAGWTGVASGSGSMAIPLAETIGAAGFTTINFYAQRMPNANNDAWLPIALALLGGALIQGTGCQNMPTLGRIDCSGVFGWGYGNSAQIIGLAPYGQPNLVGASACAGCSVTADLVAAAISTGADIVNLEMGTNDCEGTYPLTAAVPPATIEAHAQQAINEVVAAGKIALIDTIPPNNTPGTAASKECIAEYNAWVRQQGRAQQVIVVDFWSYVADPATGNWLASGAVGTTAANGGVPAGASLSLDGTHPNTWFGAYRFAQAMVDALKASGVVAPVTTSSGAVVGGGMVATGQLASTNSPDTIYTATYGVNPEGNMLVNGGVTNAAGSCSGGTYPDDWCGTAGGVTVNHTPAGGSLSPSVIGGPSAGTSSDPTSRYYWVKVLMTQGTGADYGDVNYWKQDALSENGGTQSASTWLAGTTQVYMQATFRLSCQAATGANTGMLVPSMQVGFVNASGVSMGVVSVGLAGMAWAANDPGSCMAYGVLRSPPFVIPQGTGQFFPQIRMTGVTDAANGFQFTNVQVRAWP